MRRIFLLFAKLIGLVQIFWGYRNRGETAVRIAFTSVVAAREDARPPVDNIQKGKRIPLEGERPCEPCRRGPPFAAASFIPYELNQSSFGKDFIIAIIIVIVIICRKMNCD